MVIRSDFYVSFCSHETFIVNLFLQNYALFIFIDPFYHLIREWEKHWLRVWEREKKGLYMGFRKSIVMLERQHEKGHKFLCNIPFARGMILYFQEALIEGIMAVSFSDSSSYAPHLPPPSHPIDSETNCNIFHQSLITWSSSSTHKIHIFFCALLTLPLGEDLLGVSSGLPVFRSTFTVSYSLRKKFLNTNQLWLIAIRLLGRFSFLITKKKEDIEAPQEYSITEILS